jgi:hypothetical protein
MTAARNTIFALGLILSALSAGKSALGASVICSDGSACQANCGAAGEASCDTGCKPEDPGPEGNCTKTMCMDDDPAFAACRQCFKDFCETCEGYTWKADASALILHRSTPGTRTVLLDSTGGDLFDASKLEFPYAAGPRLSLTALDCEGWGFELNYFGVDGWSADTGIPNASLSGGSANLIADSVTQIPLADAHFESIARLYSSEFNFRGPLFGNISILAGFRWLELTDQYVADGTSTTGYAVSETILTHNHLYGFQMGADGMLAQQANRWRLTGFVKGGIFLNNSDQATSLSDPDPLGPGSNAVNNSQIGAAFFGETGLVCYFQITEHLSASGGYQVMFVNNVAQPVNQLAGTNLANHTAIVDVSSGLFYQGATAGLEVTW